MLSKSKFILGQQCIKSFWLDINNIEPTNPPDDGAKERLSAGNEVGEISKQIFSGGKEVPYLPGKEKEMFRITKKFINDGVTSIYEGSFIYDDIFVRVDLMHKTKKGWDIYEVKSSSSVRSYHEYDASIQWHVLKKLNIFDLNEVFIITLNNKFSKKKKINPINLFNIHPVTEIVDKNKLEVENKINELKEISMSHKEPELKIGLHCKKPHACVYFDKCWPSNINEINSVFKLYRLPLKKKLKLYNEGIDTYEKITNTESFSSIQKLQLEAYKKKTPVINKNKIKAFINKIKYPISYFDFETFTDAIPIFDKQRPHMQMPFQYSLHIQMNEDEKLEIDDNHFEFIAEHDKDPRRSIAESMIKNFPKDGTIIAYNQSFEKRCVQSLAEYCPDLSDELLALNERFIDLIEPFRGGGFYHSKFKGSFSIKNVLPVICPSNSVLDYKALDINNGGMAMSAYKELRNSSKNVDIETTRKNLFKYCRLDTYAMYAIYIKLLEIIK
tara:strand:+ start:128 stop:1624 length:1497 start_codon:yes stop_codon:yes gene_type:complete